MLIKIGFPDHPRAYGFLSSNSFELLNNEFEKDKGKPQIPEKNIKVRQELTDFTFIRA